MSIRNDGIVSCMQIIGWHNDKPLLCGNKDLRLKRIGFRMYELICPKCDTAFWKLQRKE